VAELVCGKPVDNLFERGWCSPAAVRYRHLQTTGEDRPHCQTAELIRAVAGEIVPHALRAEALPTPPIGGWPVAEATKAAGVNHAPNDHFWPLQQEGSLSHGQERAHRRWTRVRGAGEVVIVLPVGLVILVSEMTLAW
jgi:hypothetical protein